MSKLTAKSPAKQQLIKKFLSGEITGEEEPKTVWESDPLFQRHKLNTFRVHYNQLRKNPPKKQDAEITILSPRNSENMRKKRKTNSFTASRSVSSNSANVSVADDGIGRELTIGDCFFKPLYLIGTWEEPGVDRNNFSLSIQEGGTSLELCVTWPDPLIDLELLHTKWLKSAASGQDVQFTMYHPAVLGLENALKEKRHRASENVSSTARIPLPFAVQTHIEGKSNLSFRSSGTKLVYVELKAMAENYSVVVDNEEFEEF